MSETWHPVIAEADFPEEGKATTIVNGWYVLLGKVDGQYHAVNDRCTHAASFLSTGRIRRGAVMCPLHGARFELASGRCLGSAYRDLRTFAVRVENGQIEVQVPDVAPSMEELPISL
jgi:nitrite reductase/ring-hydroxylating ferredoxin subunit